MAEKAKHLKDRISKKELLKQVKANLTRVHSEVSLTTVTHTVDALVESILNYIKQGKSVFWSGFGLVSIQKRKQTIRRNPHNGQEIKIPAKEVIKMKLFKSFSDKCLVKTPKKNGKK
jgi:nucleoid DNA-binding protein